MKVTYADCRGEATYTYGFIYFDDGSWVGYRPHDDDQNRHRFFPGDKGGNTAVHYRTAFRYLRTRERFFK